MGHFGAQLAIGVVAGATFFLAMVGLAIMVKRRVQRRWVLFRSRLWGLVGPRLAPAARDGRPWSSVQPFGDPRRWPGYWTRLRMWNAVASAERSVADAEQTGAPVGDLPVLCRRLRVAAQDLDRVLRATPVWGDAQAGSRSARGQVAQLVSAARSIEETAAAGISEFGAASVGDLAGDVRREVQALRAGLRQSREALKL